MPLTSRSAVVELIASTTTKTGLKLTNPLIFSDLDVA
jgi:hypothetical protein